MMVKEYAVYKGDEFLLIGTAKECAAELGCSINTFRFYLTPSYEKRIIERNASNCIVVVKFDDEDLT